MSRVDTALRLFAVCCAVIVLGTSAYVLDQTVPEYWGWNAMALTASLATILSLVPMMIARPSAARSWSRAGLVWLFILCVLWLATAVYEHVSLGETSCAVRAGNFWTSGVTECGDDEESEDWIDSDDEYQLCRVVLALEAFTFISWLVLMALFFYNVVLSRQSTSRIPSEREDNASDITDSYDEHVDPEKTPIEQED